MLKVKVGDVFKVVSNNSSHGFEIGEEVTITELYDMGGRSEHYQAKNSNGVIWYLNNREIVPSDGVSMVTITKEEYECLLEDSKKLERLEVYGVDNWSGYGEAMSDEQGLFEEE